MLILWFENLVDDLPAAVRQVAQFLQLRLDSTAADRVIERCSLQYMKRNSKLYQLPACASPPGARPTQMVQQGLAGAGRRNVPPDLRQAFKLYYHRVLDGTGFPVEQYSGSF